MKHFGNLAAIAFATVCTASVAVADVTLRYSNWLPPTHPFQEEVVGPWIEDVARVTEGRVKIQVLPKVVGTVPTQFEVVRDGLADIAMIVDGYSPSRFKLGGIVELPFLGNDERAVGLAYWRIYHKYFEPFGEYEGVELAGVASVGPLTVATVEGPIESIGDLGGLKLRVASPIPAKICSLLGAVAVKKPISEAYELISTGVVDGMMASDETLESYKLADIIQHVLRVPGGFGGGNLSFIVNKDSLAQLSPEDLEAFWSVSGEVLSLRASASYGNANAEGRQALLDAGGSVGFASDEMVEELKSTLAPIEQDWIDRAKEAGLSDPAAVLADLRSEIAALEKELAEQ